MTYIKNDLTRRKTMTQVSQTTIKRFRNAFPEMAHYSDMEAAAYCRAMKREKKKVDNYITKRIKHYEK
jgi:hypothetical protein